MHLLSRIKINICEFVKVRSVKEFFVFLKNKIIEAVTGRRPYEEDFEEGEKGYQVCFFYLFYSFSSFSQQNSVGEHFFVSF